MFFGNFLNVFFNLCMNLFNFKDILYKIEKNKLFLILKIYKILILVCNCIKLFFYVFFLNK